LIYIIIILHFLSDWIFQPRSVAKRKSSSLKWMAKHLIVIYLVFTVLAIYLHIPHYWVILNTVSHFIIDKNIWTLYKKIRVGDDYPKEYLEKNKYAEDYWYFFTIAIDQIIHLSILMFIFIK